MSADRVINRRFTKNILGIVFDFFSDVSVAIDQSRQNPGAVEVDDFGFIWNGEIVGDLFDDLAFNQDHLIGEHRPADGIQQVSRFDNGHQRRCGSICFGQERGGYQQCQRKNQ